MGNRTAQPRGGDVIEITVVKVDDLNLEATVAGTATADGPVKISGVIIVHRGPGYKALLSGAWQNCDPVIYDKLFGAEARSPSECEVKFDLHVRKILAKAVTPVAPALTAGDWTQTAAPNTGAIDSLPRKSEAGPYRLAIRQEFRLRPDSQAAKRNQSSLAAITGKMADALKNPAAATAFQAELLQTTHAIESSATIVVSIGINSASVGITSFKASHTVTQIPGVGLSVSASYVQAATGGDIGASHEMTYVFLDSWAQPAVTKSGDGEEITVKAGLNPKASTLAVQNVTVSIQANSDLAQKVIGLIDWNVLKQLLTP
jgi:hypothetical protein